MRFQTILGVGVVAILAYLVYTFFESQTVQGAATAAGSFIENAATGQLSQAQLNDLANQEAQGLLTASNGSLSPAQAQAQAQADVKATAATSTLTYWDGVKAAFSELNPANW